MKPPGKSRDLATLETNWPSKDRLCIQLSGRLETASVNKFYKQLRQLTEGRKVSELKINLSDLESCDTAGAAFLFLTRQYAESQHTRTEFQNTPEFVQHYFEQMEGSDVVQPEIEHTIIHEKAIAHLGKVTVDFFSDLKLQITFLGHLCACLLYCLLRPDKIRYRDFWRTCEQAGADAVPIVAMLGLLFGLILAFSSAMPLQQFGVEIYVADLVAMALVRVLGPFITAIILAGRTGSSFAAELGTMKINNEIDALEVMSLDPVRFLVVPRTLATTFMTPLLTIITIATGIIGAGFVILSLGYPLVTYWSHIQNMITAQDLCVGLFKAFVFGGLVASIGALRGLQTGLGPGAVGISTTRAVVTSIIAIVIAEGIFSVVFYYTGI